MMERLMRSPIPVPWGLVVKKALKICSACFGGSPTPLSVTDTTTSSFSARCDLMASSRVSFTSFIASMLFMMRFISTCCNCTRSPMTCGSSASSSVRTDIEYRIASLRSRTIISRMTSFTSTKLCCGDPFLKSSRIRLTISPARVPSFTVLMAVAREPAYAGIGVGDGGGNRLIHFVGDGGCQFSHGHNLRDVGEFGLRFVIPFFRTPAFGHFRPQLLVALLEFGGPVPYPRRQPAND